MHIDHRRFARALAVLILADALFFGIVAAPRPALTDEQWDFIEQQRPRFHGSSMELNLCHDCLNFALARRGFGGWESISGNLLLLLNLPGHFAAIFAFHALQDTPGGTSKAHSDISTAVFCAVAVVQWTLVAAMLSLRRRRP